MVNKRIVSVLLAVLLCISLLPANVFAEGGTVQHSAAVETAAITNPTVTWSSGETFTNNLNRSGSGTAESPYLIYTKEELDNVRTDLSAQYMLMADIIFSAADFEASGAYCNQGAGFVPIGNDSTPFTGVLDGNGHTITGLYQSITAADENVYAGLFGYINGGTVKSLGMVDCEIIASTSASTPYYYPSYAGSVAGYVKNGTKISDCYSTGSVSSTSTSSSSNTYAYAGGIVGFANSSATRISDCYNTGSINARSASSYSDTYAYAGGVAGYVTNSVKISTCYNIGSVNAATTSTPTSRYYAYSHAGGIAGDLYSGTATNCYNTGSVNAASTAMPNSFAYARAGGITGHMYSSSCLITTCYNTGRVGATSSSFHSHAAGIVGYISYGTVSESYYLDSISTGVGYGTDTATKLTHEQMQLQSSFTSLDFNTVWTMAGNGEFPYPELKAVDTVLPEENADFASGRGTSYSPYHITSKVQLSSVRDNLAAWFVMDNDITFTKADFEEGGAYYNQGTGFAPIGSNTSPFIGEFNGNGHTITGLYQHVSSTDTNVYAGLFGYIGGGTVKNLGIADSDIVATSASSYDESCVYAGGIAGYITDSAKLSACYNTGSVSAASTPTTSDPITYSYAGGIAGYVYNSAEISACYNTGSVSAASATSFSQTYAGGVAGCAAYLTTVTGCYNRGNVRAAGASQAYIGGVAGHAGDGTITETYYLDRIATGVGYGTDTTTKLTHEQMTVQSSFTGFDFDTVWTMAGAGDYLYPELLNTPMRFEKKTESVTITTLPTKLAYAEGKEELDVTGGKISVYYNNGTAEDIDMTESMVTGFDNTDVGMQTLTVTYEGKTAAFDVEIIALLLGDANGSGHVDVSDAALVLRWIVKLVGDAEIDLNAANVTGNSVVSAADAAKILRWIVNLIPTLEAD